MKFMTYIEALTFPFRRDHHLKNLRGFIATRTRTLYCTSVCFSGTLTRPRVIIFELRVGEVPRTGYHFSINRNHPRQCVIIFKFGRGQLTHPHLKVFEFRSIKSPPSPLNIFQLWSKQQRRPCHPFQFTTGKPHLTRHHNSINDSKRPRQPFLLSEIEGEGAAPTTKHLWCTVEMHPLISTELSLYISEFHKGRVKIARRNLDAIDFSCTPCF